VNVRLSALAERVRASLFVVPLAFVVFAVLLAEATLLLDSAVDARPSDFPLGVTSTVASARAVLSTVAGATITVAGIAFSVSLLVIQQASSQYSPRVLHGLFRDPFNKRVIGVTVGTFAYCLIILRAVRSPLDRQGGAVIPNISVALGVVLGITSILATIAFISHNAHSMEISQILAVITGDAVAAIRRGHAGDTLAESPRQLPDVVPDTRAHTVRFEQEGWIQLLDLRALVEAAPEGATVRLDTAPGHYAFSGAPVCTVWPVPDDPEGTSRAMLAATRVGESRTLQQDPAYGVRQLADVALRALSPGVNDPTTAQDAIYHLGSVLREFLLSAPPARDRAPEGRRLVLHGDDGYDALLTLAYEEIRQAAATQPKVCEYLVASMGLVGESLPPDRRIATAAALHHQARLVVEACERRDPFPADLDALRTVYARHFGRPQA
jgi:uncharacterized membrane protein